MIPKNIIPSAITAFALIVCAATNFGSAANGQALTLVREAQVAQRTPAQRERGCAVCVPDVPPAAPAIARLTLEMPDQLHSWVEAISHNIPVAAGKAEIVNDLPNDKLDKLSPEFLAYYNACQAARKAGDPYMDADNRGRELKSTFNQEGQRAIDKNEDTLVERFHLTPDFQAALKKCIAAEDAALKAAGTQSSGYGRSD